MVSQVIFHFIFRYLDVFQAYQEVKPPSDAQWGREAVSINTEKRIGYCDIASVFIKQL